MGVAQSFLRRWPPLPFTSIFPFSSPLHALGGAGNPLSYELRVRREGRCRPPARVHGPLHTWGGLASVLSPAGGVFCLGIYAVSLRAARHKNPALSGGPQGFFPVGVVNDCKSSVEWDGLHSAVLRGWDFEQMRNDCDRPGCLHSGIAAVLEAVPGGGVGVMLKFTKKGCFCLMHLDQAMIRMCGKYEVNPEAVMQAALLREIHTRAASWEAF